MSTPTNRKSLSDMIRASIPSDEELNAIRQRRIEAAKHNPNCFTHWFSVVERLGILSPKSKVVYFPAELSGPLLDGCTEDLAAMLAPIVSEIQSFGGEAGYPLFLKNSLFSGKHSWVDTCFVPSPDAVSEHIQAINMDSAMVGCDLSLYLVAREMIETKPAFHAFRGETPIVEEFRLFARDGKTEGYQPYWPEMAIRHPSAPDWREKLRAISVPSQEDLAYMVECAEKITSALGGYWSVDFLRGADDRLWLIDMALGQCSFKCDTGFVAC